MTLPYPQHGVRARVFVYFEVVAPRVGWYLSSAINSTTTSVILAYDAQTRPEDPAAGDILSLRSEDMMVTAWNSGTKTATVVRGYGDSEAIAHAAAGDGFVNYGVRVWREIDYLEGTQARRPRLLTPYPRLPMSVESALNFASAADVNLYLDNADGYFNDPTRFRGWHQRGVRFYSARPLFDSAGENVSGEKAAVEAAACYIIDDLECGGDVAVFRLVSPDVLIRSRSKDDAASAEDVKDRSWYPMKSGRFLIERLLAGRYQNARESVPRHWVEGISPNLEIPVTGEEPMFSEYGRPPEWDGTRYIESTGVCRSVLYDHTNELLYMGIDNELWVRDLATNTDTLVYTQAADGDGAYVIPRIWRHHSGTIVFLALKDRLVHNSPDRIDDFTPEQYLRTFTYEPSTGTTTQRGARYIVSGYFNSIRLYPDFVSNIYAETPIRVYGEAALVAFRQYIRPDPSNEFPGLYPPISQPPTDHYEDATHIKLNDAAASTLDWFNDPFNPVHGAQHTTAFRVERGFRGVIGKERTSGYVLLIDHAIVFSMGGRGALAYDQYTGTKGTVFYARMSKDGTDNYTMLSRVDCATGGTADSVTKMYNQQPTTLAVGGSSLVVGTFRSDNFSTTFQYSESYIHQYNTGLLFQMTNWSPPVGNQRCFQPLEIIIHDSTILVSLVDRSGFYDQGAPYRVGEIPVGAVGYLNLVQAPDGGVFYTSQVMGFARLADLTSVPTDHLTWAVSGGGHLLRFSPTGHGMILVGQVPGLVDGEPATTGALSGTVQSTGGPTTYRIFGVSAPYAGWAGEVVDDPQRCGPHPGKYHLWKVDRYLADRFQLAEFLGMDRYDGIANIANALRHCAYFDRRGNFRLVAIPETAGPTPILFLSEDGTAENMAQQPPWDAGPIYSAWLVKPKMSWGYREVYNLATATPFVQTLELPGAPVLRLSEGSPYRRDNWTDEELDDWVGVHGDVSRPTIAVAGSSEFPIRIVMRCVKTGKLSAVDATANPRFVRVIDEPKLNLVLLRPTTPGSGILSVDRIPTDGAARVVFEASADAGRGDFVTIGDRDYFSASDRKITDYSIGASTITVSPVINSTNDPESPYGTGSSVVIIPRTSARASSQVYAFRSGVPVEIYPGVALVLESKAEFSQHELPIVEGDYIVVEIPGAQLKRAEYATQTIIDTASINAGYGKRNANLPENRLLDPARGLELARRTVAAYRFPHANFEGGAVRMIPALEPLIIAQIHGRRSLPASPGNEEICYVRAFVHDLESQSTELDLRGTRELSS